MILFRVKPNINSYKRLPHYLVLLVALVLVSCNTQQEERVRDRPSGGDISITWKLISNNYQDKGSLKSVFTLVNKSTVPLTNKNWELYFNHILCRKILIDSLSSFVKIIHVNGDFYKIVPTEKFPVVGPSDSIDIPLLTNYVAIKYSDIPGGLYFVFKDASGKYSLPEPVTAFRIESFKPEQITRGKNDHVIVPDPTSVYQENLQLKQLSSTQIPLIIPSPLSVDYLKDTLHFDASFEIHFEKNLEVEAHYLAASLTSVFKKNIKAIESSKSGNKIILLKREVLPFNKSPEAYLLSVSQKDGIRITGNGNAGVFYAIQSLRALLPVEAYSKVYPIISLPDVIIKDAPSFSYRGILLDVARNFQSKESVLKMLEVFSFYKINTLTLHLTDDEGWRLEIEELPELTEIGSKRGHTLNEEDCLIPAYGSGPFVNQSAGSGYYSRKDFMEILRYAKERHITVIPEIDLPGHARAAIKAMDVRYKRWIAKGNSKEAEKYLLRDIQDQSEYRSVQQFNDNVVCPCQEGLFNFINTVAEDVQEMYKESGVTLSSIHIGGDEVPVGVWKRSPACNDFISRNKEVKNTEDIKHYFLTRVNQILNSKKIFTSAYEDLLISSRKDSSGKSKVEIRKEFIPSNMRLFSWSNVWGWGSEDFSYRLANEGFPVVLGHVTNLYFDLAYSKDPEEPGQYWGGFNDTRKAFEYTPLNIYHAAYKDIDGNPIDKKSLKDKVRLTEKGKSNIVGLQGLLFSETLKNNDMVEYFLFPKMIGLAERAWAKNPLWATVAEKEERLTLLNTEWNIFANTIGQRELPRLDFLAGGINYHLPMPGAVIENNFLKMNISFPGLVLRYTLDGSDPDASSKIYTTPIKVDGQVKVCTFSKSGRRGRVFAIVPLQGEKSL